MCELVPYVPLEQLFIPFTCLGSSPFHLTALCLLSLSCQTRLLLCAPPLLLSRPIDFCLCCFHLSLYYCLYLGISKEQDSYGRAVYVEGGPVYPTFNLT